MNKIKVLLNKRYSIPPIEAIDKVAVKNSKFTGTDNHWLVTTKTNAYFLKKYSQSHAKKVSNEIRAVKLLEGTILTPEVIRTKRGGYYMKCDTSVYILYKYIRAKNLKDSNIDKYKYFGILCKTQNQLLMYGYGNKYYNFKDHIKRCEMVTGELLRHIPLSTRSEASHDLTYVTFLNDELKNIEKEVQSLKIKSSLVHGDMLMQNILEHPESTFWVIDWEKSREYIAIIDILRCIILTIIDSNKKDLNLNKNIFLRDVIFCLKNINLNKDELKHAMNLFYFHLVTNTDFLERVYIEGQDLIRNRTREDFIICAWIKKHKDEFQSRINNDFSIT